MLRHPLAAILFFELLGTLVFAYGTCVARYLHPIEQRHLNPTFHFLISSFYYFALSIATPFSGGHLNPAVAAAFHRLRTNAHLWQEMAAQVLGAVLGTGIGKRGDSQRTGSSEWCRTSTGRRRAGADCCWTWRGRPSGRSCSCSSCW